MCSPTSTGTIATAFMRVPNLLGPLQQRLEPATVARVMGMVAGAKADPSTTVQAGQPWSPKTGAPCGELPERIDVPNTTQLNYCDDVEHSTFDGVVVATTTQRIYVRNGDIT
jgi:hypothetical protein